MVREQYDDWYINYYNKLISFPIAIIVQQLTVNFCLLITVAVLCVELFIYENCRKEVEILEKCHYIPIFLLCQFFNFLSMIMLLKSVPDDMGGDTCTYLQFMTIYIVTIYYITVQSFIDGLFIYHKFRNVTDFIF